jgi:hypothetical protein
MLVDAYRVEQLMKPGGDLAAGGRLLDVLLAAALVGLRHYVEQPDLRSPADRRLAFRELGLAIGLAAVGLLEEDARRAPELFPGGALASLDQLARYTPVRADLESFWLELENRQTDPWLAHSEINDVMLATSLVPEGFLVLQPMHLEDRAASRSRRRRIG